ncbi:MAG: DUF262 domain-containing protein [Acidobacteria bacterium]|jgi:uncharacterized protein with ParB-like and HNH nuclease domain|nr:DUF262 domain-containing protein [Acidobacteriota bacterium]
MKASETSLNRFLAQTDTQFIIPVYQRNYDWNLLQCKELFEDIIKVGSDEKQASHFVGSIVYIHDNVYSVAGIRELSIIDGQQRLSTVTLIYIALYSLAKETGNQALVNRIQETYLINKFAQEEEKLKLRPTERNDKALKFLLKNDPHDEYREYSRLIENYNYFKGRINSDNTDSVIQGLNKLIFVEISLERDKDDPQKIFESLNSTGLELSQSDLIRNYILMGLKHKDQTNIYENYWRHIEVSATQEETNANKVSDFIRDFLTLENRDIPNKGKVYQEFKKKYPITEIENLEKILTKIKKYSIYYNKFINPHNETDLDIRSQLALISRLEINVAYPFLLEVYNDYASNVINKSTLIEILELLQSFTWRRFVIGLPTNSLNKIFMRLYEDVDSSDYVSSLQRTLLRKKSSQRFPRDREVIATLKDRDMYGIQTKNRAYFFEKLENYENREPVKIEGNPDITVEHIFPQNPDPKWKIELKDEQYNLIKEKYLNTVANLTLSGNNGKLSNKFFTDKRDLNIDGKEQGYKFSRLWLNKHLATLNKWDIEEIEKRFELIGERFLKIWTFPSILLAETTNETEEINIFDAEDPTYKKLEYAIFFNQKLDVKTVSDLYATVMISLFELNPEAFFTEEVERKLTLTKHAEDCREVIELNDTYFIEKHMSSKDKFDRLKVLLNAMDLEDELLIKYSVE